MIPNPSRVRFAAIFGALAVALGAFGAHALEELLVKNGTVEIWRTASHYHFIHVLALLVLGLIGERAGKSWTFLAAGTLVFSGSLYLLALTNIKWLGAVTPVGGLLMIIGWLLLARRFGRQA
ncbi:MAG: rane protein [Verrucomicrobiaceae bacterium]|nr:rane protein [Verrucomicrobiaceae bacterium]